MTDKMEKYQRAQFDRRERLKTKFGTKKKSELS